MPTIAPTILKTVRVLMTPLFVLFESKFINYNYLTRLNFKHK